MSGRVLSWVLGLVLLALVVLGIRQAGVNAERRAQKVEQLTTDLATTRSQLSNYEGRVQATTQLASERTKSAERIRTVTKEVLREVHVLVPADSCPLPDGWRVLHDAAASGETPDPASSGRADGGPVAAQEAAIAVAENYGQYHDLADRHRALQRYVREQLHAEH